MHDDWPPQVGDTWVSVPHKLKYDIYERRPDFDTRSTRDDTPLIAFLAKLAEGNGHKAKIIYCSRDKNDYKGLAWYKRIS